MLSYNSWLLHSYYNTSFTQHLNFYPIKEEGGYKIRTYTSNVVNMENLTWIILAKLLEKGSLHFDFNSNWQDLNLWPSIPFLASFYFGVVLPKFKLMEIGTCVSTSIVIWLCILSFASFTFVGDYALLKIVLSHFPTCLWIFMIFAFDAIDVHCMVLASFSYLLITLSLSTTFFCIVFFM